MMRSKKGQGQSPPPGGHQIIIAKADHEASYGTAGVEWNSEERPLYRLVSSLKNGREVYVGLGVEKVGP